MLSEMNRTTHFDIAKNPDVSTFLNECTYIVEPTGEEAKEVAEHFVLIEPQPESLPNNIISIDGDSYESSLNDNLPFTRLGYVQIGNVLIKRNVYHQLGKEKFVDPFKVAELEKNSSSTIFTFPSSNMQYRNETSIRNGFRLALDNYLLKYREDSSNYKTSLRSTLFKLASYRTGAYKPSSDYELILHTCPNPNCIHKNIPVLDILEKQYCPYCNEPIYPSDCLRIWENVEENASNQVALTRFTNVIEHLFAIHFIHNIVSKSPQGYVDGLSDIAFFIDGSLAIYGNPAWVHKAIMSYLFEINDTLIKYNKKPLLIIGIIKSNELTNYFKFIEPEIPKSSILCLSDALRNNYVSFGKTASGSTFGNETYYGQDFIYKSSTNKLVVFNLPYPFKSKEPLKTFITEKSNWKNYTNLNRALLLLDEFECNLHENTVVPVALARKHTIISLKPGNQVLDLLTKNNL